MRALLIWIAPALLFASSADAEEVGAKRVVVYPLDAPTAELRIYSRPIADAIAEGLARKLGAEVVVSEDTGDAPKGVDLVIDGSIHPEKKGVALSARIRDPDTGVTVGVASAAVGPIEELEASARALIADLAPVAQKWRKKQRVRAPVRLKGSTLEVETGGENGAESPDRPPLFVVARAGGNAAGGAVRVDVDATDATYAFVERLGVNFARSAKTGSDDAVVLANEARTAGSLYALAFYLRDVEFSYQGVLSARGSAVIRLIDRNGTVVLQKRVATDTVVGSRGDRHTALIFAVAEQCLDIALPELKKALAR